MRRKAFLDLTGLSTDDLKNLTRRGALPLMPLHGHDIVDGEARVDIQSADAGWREYSALDAIRTLVAQRLAALGLSQSEAAEFVRRYSERLRLVAKVYPERSTDLFFGAASAEGLVGLSTMVHPWAPVVGPIEGLKLATGHGSALNWYDLSDCASAVRALALVNVSEVIRTTAAKAAGLGIDEDFSTARDWF